MYITEEIKKKIDDMPAAERDMTYRYLWHEHVTEDVEAHAEEMDIDLTDAEIDAIADRYVYEGDYDCNISYWDNIENLIHEIHGR